MSTSDPGQVDAESGGGAAGGATTDGSSSTVNRLLSNPVGFINAVISRRIVTAILAIVAPLVSALVLLVGGSEPGTFGDPTEAVWGLADLPALGGRAIYTAGVQLVSGYFESIRGFIAGATPVWAGPFDLLVTYVVMVATLVVTVVLTIRVVRAVLSAFPILSGVETLIWG